MRFSSAVGAGVLRAGLLLVFGCHAQQTPRPEFEVASIKLSNSNRMPGGQLRMGLQVAGNKAEYVYMTLRQLVAEAYQVKPFQVDCPDWCSEQRFDIMATLPAGTRKEDAPLMLQALLQERFKLAAHRESREENVSALLIAPGGPKLTESPPEGQSASTAVQTPGNGRPAAPRKDAGPSVSGMQGKVAVRATLDAANSVVRLEASRATMSDLARFLMSYGASSGRPIVDMTGLEGEYEIALDIPVAIPQEAPPGSAAASAAPSDDASEPAARLLRNLKSYGLELKKTKAPVEHLLVDHAEKKPTEN